MIKPKRLSAGSKIAAVTLSWGGPGAIPHRYDAGKRQFEEAFGVEVVEAEHALRDAEWIQRNPRARAADLMAAFADPTVAGIVSSIGGDDSLRILPHLGLKVEKKGVCGTPHPPGGIEMDRRPRRIHRSTR